MNVEGWDEKGLTGKEKVMGLYSGERLFNGVRNEKLNPAVACCGSRNRGEFLSKSEKEQEVPPSTKKSGKRIVKKRAGVGAAGSKECKRGRGKCGEVVAQLVWGVGKRKKRGQSNVRACGRALCLAGRRGSASMARTTMPKFGKGFGYIRRWGKE